MSNCPPLTLKTLVVLLAGWLAPGVAWGQGTVFFGNRFAPAGLDAPVLLPSGVRAGGYWFRAELLAGPSASALIPVDAPVSMATDFNGRGTGYWDATIVTLPTVRPGDSTFVAVRVWSTFMAPTYEGVSAVGGLHGQSEVLSVRTGGLPLDGTSPPLLPGALTGLRSIVLTGVDLVPEPSVVRLLGVGGVVIAALGQRRRRGGS